MTSKKKMVLIGALVLIMAISAIAGTLAYLTDSASLDNIFLVGAFTPPTDPQPSPTPPGPPDNPDPEPKDPTDFGTPNGYIFEPYWNLNGKDSYTAEDNSSVPGDKHRLLAGETTVKDPYIGIGKESESGYVLACITNPMGANDSAEGNLVYFTLCPGWEPVEGYVTEVTIDANNGSIPAVTGDSPKFYSAGLFKWVGVDDSNHTKAGGKLEALTPADTNGDGTADADAWTKYPVFTYVYTAKNGLDTIKALPADSKKMTVWAFIHQTSGKANASATTDTEATTEVVVNAAKDWATGTCGYKGATTPTT